MVTGVARFGSLSRMSGTEVSGLVTDGIYAWSRNPRNVGWGLCLFGIAVMGRSGLVLLLALIFGLVFGLYVPWEERYLDEKFGGDYRRYLLRTHRFFGPPTSD